MRNPHGDPTLSCKKFSHFRQNCSRFNTCTMMRFADNPPLVCRRGAVTLHKSCPAARAGLSPTQRPLKRHLMRLVRRAETLAAPCTGRSRPAAAACLGQWSPSWRAAASCTAGSCWSCRHGGSHLWMEEGWGHFTAPGGGGSELWHSMLSPRRTAMSALPSGTRRADAQPQPLV